MITISQNKKIAIASIAIFMVSFSTLVFFLDQGNEDDSHGKANVIHADENQEKEEGKAEGQEKKEKKAYDKMLAEIEAAAFVTNVEGIIKEVNEPFGKMFEDSQEFGEKPLFDFVNSKDVSELASKFSKIVHDGEEQEGLGPYRMYQGEKEILLLFNVKTVLDKEEKVSYLVIEVKDISEKAEDFNKEEESKNDAGDEEAADGDENEEKNWFHQLYPKLENVEERDGRLMVIK